jgi:DNA gyrase inhibitor GyrI
MKEGKEIKAKKKIEKLMKWRERNGRLGEKCFVL